MKYRATLSGTIDAKALLQALPEAVSQRVLQGALQKALQPFAEAFRAAAPRGDRTRNRWGKGHAADTIKARVVDKDLVGAHVSVAPLLRGFYLYFQDIGVPGKSNAAGTHIGFSRRAFDATEAGILPAFVEEVDRRVVAKCREISRRAG